LVAVALWFFGNNTEKSAGNRPLSEVPDLGDSVAVTKLILLASRQGMKKRSSSKCKREAAARKHKNNFKRNNQSDAMHLQQQWKRTNNE
jgi:hypothetical protein